MKDMKKIGHCQSAATSYCSWSPDGRKFLTAVTTPQMRVDNLIKIFYYDGTLL
jgi:translation initiation factor 2A